ncbi:DUF4956 domain-containing protein [Marinoscillum sp. 108]|jgi:uncharacterized membrane protein YhiD involved in acid resistance|uniref:DUF4956 domain-containing protein n=1 Tax=Marinoscillum sp. 108 TaxID=2653151 RepID=UPI0012F02CED|nr:DUF4956 domain-containing protein [Marinoscillum sp. 108]VXD12019.1 conserved membrane hypothetical protein [Marinoscillum sp. 108]
MFDKFLEGNQYYDYPSFEVAIFSLLLALVLSTSIAYIYRFTNGDEFYSKSFFQAMVLSALVTSMIMMAVGNNLAVGFGIIGAVAIIRFRTNIQNPRNVIFIFAALSVGIASGVHGYAVAIAGTIIFCITAILLYWSPAGGKMSHKFEVICQSSDHELIQEVKAYLIARSKSFDELELRKRTELNNRYEYLIFLEDESHILEIFEYLQSLEGISDVRIIKKPIPEQL